MPMGPLNKTVNALPIQASASPLAPGTTQDALNICKPTAGHATVSCKQHHAGGAGRYAADGPERKRTFQEGISKHLDRPTNRQLSGMLSSAHVLSHAWHGNAHGNSKSQKLGSSGRYSVGPLDLYTVVSPCQVSPSPQIISVLFAELVGKVLTFRLDIPVRIARAIPWTYIASRLYPRGYLHHPPRPHDQRPRKARHDFLQK